MAKRLNHCIGVRYLSSEKIQSILKSASEIKDGQLSIDLNNKIVVHLFFEPSTRTRLSFGNCNPKMQCISNDY